MPDERIPADVLTEALRLAMKIHCSVTTESCLLPEHAQRLLQIINRQLRQWERERHLSLCQRIKPSLRPEGAISMGTRWVIEDESRRRRTQPHPETRGFVIDHETGEKWRRFK